MFKYLFIYISIIILNIDLLSQTPCFTTPDTIGCIPHKVTLNDCSGSSAVVYIYEENDVKDTTTSDTYTYTTGGNHTITQLINTPSGIKSVSKTDYIKTIDRPEPNFTLYACEGLEVLIEINSDDYEKYIISYDDGSQSDTALPFTVTKKTFLNNLEKKITVVGYYEDFDCENNTSKSVSPIMSLEEPQLISLKLRV